MGNRKGICLRTASIKGFTLIELMVVITIIGLVSVLTLPGIVTAIGERRLDSSAQLLQGAIAGARDKAIHDNAPAGIRLMPNPANPAVLNRIVPLVAGGSYSNGFITLPTPAYVPPVPCLTIVQSLVGPDGLACEPTAWNWNARVGDRVKIGLQTYTICGPVYQPNADGFVNYDPAGTPFPIGTTGAYLDFLQLVNGRDDDGDGFVDNGFDGVNQNLNFDAAGNPIIDELAEWEVEKWLGSFDPISAYALFRRPTPGPATANLTLSVPVSVTASTLPTNTLSGAVDIMISPTGIVDLSGPYASPAAVGLGQAKSVFALDDGSGNTRKITLWTRTGLIESE